MKILHWFPLFVTISSFAQSPNNPNLAHYGLIISTPCGFNGTAKINFSFNDKPNYYEKIVQIPAQKCLPNAQTNKVPVDIFLAQGKWQISSISINDYTKNLGNNFVFTIQQDELSKPFFYAGTFDIKFNTQKSISNLFFDRSYALQDFKQYFGQNRVFSGYNGARLVKDKLLGTETILLLEVSVASVPKAKLDAFKNAAITQITSCLHDAAAVNPLLAIDGSVLLSSPNNSPLHYTDFKFPNNTPTVEDFKKCLIARLVSKNLPTIIPLYVMEAEISSL